MTYRPESDTEPETGRRFTSADILEALQASGPDACIIEQEAGCYVIDGHFDLEAAMRMLCEKLGRRPA